MKKPAQGGFVLLEIVMAIALFAVVATSMVVALDRLAVASNTSRVETRIFRRMESVMTEVAFRPNSPLTPGSASYAADASGVKVDVEISPENYIAQNGSGLDGMYRIKLRGSLEAEPGIFRTVERVVYSPATGQGAE